MYLKKAIKKMLPRKWRELPKIDREQFLQTLGEKHWSQARCVWHSVGSYFAPAHGP